MERVKRKRGAVAKLSHTVVPKVQKLSETKGSDDWGSGEELASSVDGGTDSEVETLEGEGGECSDGTLLDNGVDVEGKVPPEKGGEGGMKQKKKSGLYKAPTHEELQTLKETQNLFKSNLIRLQITELLSEVKPGKRPSVSRQLDELLHSLRDALTSLPSTEKVDLCSGLALLPRRVKYPLSLDPSSIKGKFQFLPPRMVKVAGSYLLGMMAKPHLSVDLALYIPEECLQAKDHLNYRYFHKRALYLSIIAGHLRKKRKTHGLQAVKFSLAAGNPLLPILVLTPKEKNLSKYCIQLHTCIPESSRFKSTKLGPDRNNVRRVALTQLPESPDCQCDPAPEADLPLPPTPHYNASLLCEQGAMERHLHDLYSAVQECPAIVDAVILCKVWAKQRGMDQGFGGFKGFHFAMLMVALLRQKQLNQLMSSYQILRIILQHLATTDWTSQGISLAKPDPTLPPLLSFHSLFDVVFLDSSGYLNLCANTSKDQFRQLQREASLSMGYLDDLTINGFEALFMKPVPLVQKFDTLCHIAPSNAFHSSLADPADREAVLLDGAAWPLPLILRKVLPVLYRGLGQRVRLTVIAVPEDRQWLVTSSPPDPSGGHVTLGLLLDTDHAFSILDMGPPADSSEAAQFRSFWGEKSELRRFQDGSINEAVVWEGGSVGEKRSVCHQVIRYLLKRHAGISRECVTYSAGVLDPLLSLPSYQKGGSVVWTGEEVGRRVCEVFTELSRELWLLKDLPLAITSLQGTSPVFRHTEVFPPLPCRGKLSAKLQAVPAAEDVQSECFYPSCDIATPPFTPALEVVCQLESSGKWPDEVKAIEGIKAAFYLHLASAYQEQRGGITSPTAHYLDILKGGYVFRLRIHHHREVTLLTEKVSMATGSEAKQLQEHVHRMERTLVSLPLHTSTLHGLHQQYPVFGTGVRLCKRWVSAHLLSNHITDEALELMTAHLFTCPAPYSIPGSPLCVFLRFLSLLTSHDWSSEPLIVNFNKEFSAADISEITSKFTADRPRLPPVFIATPHDKFSSPWTTPSPSPPVFFRLQLLARESLTILSQQLPTPNLIDVDFKQVFRTPLHDYNVLIHLHQRHLPLSEQGVDVTTATEGSPHKPHSHRKGHEKYSHLPVVEFNPVQQYLQELEGAFSEFALFFYDKYGGTIIAVVWKPAAFVPQPFKVMHSHCRIPAESTNRNSTRKNLLVPDVQAIVSDFKLMGGDLVKSVQVLCDSPSCT